MILQIQVESDFFDVWMATCAGKGETKFVELIGSEEAPGRACLACLRPSLVAPSSSSSLLIKSSLQLS
jgi:hypothetical protein